MQEPHRRLKVPRQVVIREALPMSGAGKILKNELRKEFRTDALGNGNSIKVASKL